MPSVLKEWVTHLGLRHQGVLMSCVRGCDNVPKEDPAKALTRCLRGVLLNSFDPRPSSFIEHADDMELRDRMISVLKNHDHYPIHYIMHLMHGAEIIGYKWPAPGRRFLAMVLREAGPMLPPQRRNRNTIGRPTGRL